MVQVLYTDLTSKCLTSISTLINSAHLQVFGFPSSFFTLGFWCQIMRPVVCSISPDVVNLFLISVDFVRSDVNIFIGLWSVKEGYSQSSVSVLKFPQVGFRPVSSVFIGSFVEITKLKLHHSNNINKFFWCYMCVNCMFVLMYRNYKLNKEDFISCFEYQLSSYLLDLLVLDQDLTCDLVIALQVSLWSHISQLIQNMTDC